MYIQRNEHAPGAAGDTRSPDSSPSSPSHYPLLGTVDGTGPNETMIKAVLNQQTLEQFSTYAAQQAPNDERQQKTIIAQLQEEHFKQVPFQFGCCIRRSLIIFFENCLIETWLGKKLVPI